jgi:hypothetical protein
MSYEYPAVTNPRQIVAHIAREETMKDLRSSRRLANLVRKWHRGDKATLDHLVRGSGNIDGSAATLHSAYTASGLAVEDQVRKAWQPAYGGIATF